MTNMGASEFVLARLGDPRTDPEAAVAALDPHHRVTYRLNHRGQPCRYMVGDARAHLEEVFE